PVTSAERAVPAAMAARRASSPVPAATSAPAAAALRRTAPPVAPVVLVERAPPRSSATQHPECPAHPPRAGHSYCFWSPILSLACGPLALPRANDRLAGCALSAH